MDFVTSDSQDHPPQFVSTGHLHDPDRLAALRSTNLLDSGTEEAFDRLTRLASKFLRAPVSLVTLVAEDRQFFKSAVGLPEPWASRREMPLEYSYCRHALASAEPLRIEDAREDPRVRESPAVTENRSIAYAGVPLTTREGQVLGTLCVVDQEPRAWTDEEVAVLKDLAASVMAEIDLRQEIADRRGAEKALRQQAVLLDLAHDCVLVRDPDGTIRSWNTGAERVYGWSREEALGKKSHVLLHTEFPRPLEEFEREVVRDGLWEGELVHVTRDGARVVVESRWALQRDEHGAPQAVLEINRDISERKGAEERLRRKNTLIQLLHTAAMAANEAETLEAAITEVIEYVCTHTGFSLGHAYIVDTDSGELVSTRLWSSDPGRFEVFRRVSEMTRLSPGAGVPGRVLATAEPTWIPEVVEEAAFTRAQEARAAGLHTGVTIPVRVGEEVAAVLEFFSESALSRDGHLLEALDSIGIQLGRVVERRRAEEAHIRAREAAESANRAKSDFLSRMSHELRTPMNAILGFAQLLEMDPLEAEQRESVEQILKGGRHLLVLINEVLDIARIEAGRMALSPEPVHVREVLDEVLSLVWPLARDRRVSLPTNFPELCHRHVRADRQRLKQVFLNLFSNGIKYNRENGRVTVSCAEMEGDRLRIAVTDTGPGITPEKRERLFQPFERLGAELNGQEEGSGLGLVLSRALIEVMDGRIDMESEPGRGSTFWVELPMSQAGVEGYEPELPAHAVIDSQEPREVRTILYIEDNLSNVKLIQRVLSHRPDVELIPAMQGSLGLELASEHQPDLILLDLNLPDLRGEEVLLRLRADQRTADISVIVLSADATPGQIQRLLDTGARAYLTKPFDVKQFLALVDEVLDEEGQ
jgi:PAS domain S-box-containing protein